jgi:hypothetical protein
MTEGTLQMTILRIEEMTYGVEKLDECIEFLERWGLKKESADASGAKFRTLENQFIQLRLIDDLNLPPSYEDGATLREVMWGVDNQAALDEIEAELGKDREVTKDKNGNLHSHDDRNNYLGFQIADIVNASIPQGNLNFVEDIKRVNERGWPEDHVMPIRIGHIVYSIEVADNWAAAEFYINRLKFRLTDRSEDGGSFLRADGSNYHHNLFLFHRQGSRPYFNHLAFEVSSFDDVMVGGTNMLKHGAKSVSGPGRHSLGSNWFWYFNNPCGGDIEYFADMDRMDENWEPRMWDKSPPYARWMMGAEEIKG